MYRDFMLLLLLLAFLMAPRSAIRACEPTTHGISKDELRERQKNDDARLISKIIRQVVPTARVSPTLEPGVIILRGKVSRQEDVETILRIARAFGAGPHNTAISEMVVDPLGLLVLELSGSNANACLNEIAKFMNLSVGFAPSIVQRRGRSADIPVYEFCAGSLILGTLDDDGNFIPKEVSTIIRFSDYKPGPGAIPIYNLPGKFERVGEKKEADGKE
jgi:hypothetical protein